jgi:hypothetical protein
MAMLNNQMVISIIFMTIFYYKITTSTNTIFNMSHWLMENLAKSFQSPIQNLMFHNNANVGELNLAQPIFEYLNPIVWWFNCLTPLMRFFLCIVTPFQTFSMRGLHSANVPGKSKEYSGVHHRIDVIWRRNMIIERHTCYNHEKVLSCASAYVDGV